MYGTKGEFEYFLCKKCGSLQIVREPEDLSKYYSNKTYYAFNMDKRSLKNRMLMEQMKYQLFGKSFLGTLVQFIYPVEYGFLKIVNPKKSALLDVGCGQGEMLSWLSKLGFQKLMGIDPYLEQSVEWKGINVQSTDIMHFNSEQKYRMITFIHSFEHLVNLDETIQKAKELLEDDGYIVLQLPYLSRYYFNKYGKNLYTLDPPRHIIIPTYQGMQILMKKYNFRLVNFTTHFDPAIPIMARNIRKGATWKNQGTGFVSGTLSSLLSLPLRHRLHEENDEPIATFVFQKKRKTDEAF